MKHTKKISIATIVKIGMFAAITAALAQVSIPLPSGVPITLQTFAIALTAFVLGWKFGTLSTIIYVILGAIGVPVFAGFTGGLAILFGKTGGFIVGFILMTFFCGFAAKSKNKILIVLFSVLGLVLCHICGILQFSFITGMGILESSLLVSIPFLIKDIVSILGAYVASLAILKALNKANLNVSIQ